jgi:hypothetical protein
VILRHDIDKLPANALEMAQLEHDLGVTGFYYFRVKPGLWNAGVMGKITELGHEPGYHYEYPAIAKGDLIFPTGLEWMASHSHDPPSLIMNYRCLSKSIFWCIILTTSMPSRNPPLLWVRGPERS